MTFFWLFKTKLKTFKCQHISLNTSNLELALPPSYLPYIIPVRNSGISYHSLHLLYSTCPKVKAVVLSSCLLIHILPPHVFTNSSCKQRCQIYVPKHYTYTVFCSKNNKGFLQFTLVSPSLSLLFFPCAADPYFPLTLPSFTGNCNFR